MLPRLVGAGGVVDELRVDVAAGADAGIRHRDRRGAHDVRLGLGVSRIGIRHLDVDRVGCHGAQRKRHREGRLGLRPRPAEDRDDRQNSAIARDPDRVIREEVAALGGEIARRVQVPVLVDPLEVRYVDRRRRCRPFVFHVQIHPVQRLLGEEIRLLGLIDGVEALTVSAAVPDHLDRHARVSGLDLLGVVDRLLQREQVVDGALESATSGR